MADKEVGAFPLWLVEGQEDPFKGYSTRPRSELPLADYTDDQLANLVYMVGDISAEQDAQRMIEAHRKGERYISRIMALTSARERIRWLSRQFLMVEGKYPGAEKPVRVDAEKIWDWLVKNDIYVGMRPNYLRNSALELLPEDYVDEKMQPILHDLIEKGVIDEDGVELSLLKRGMGLRPEKYIGRLPPIQAERLEAEHQLKVEQRAEEIYNSWHLRAGFVPWVTRGNSLHQQEARRQAAGQLAKENEEPKHG